MSDITPQAQMVRTVADQMAESLVDAAWQRMKAEQANDANRRIASWPAWGALALSILTSIVIVSMWFGVAKADIGYARAAADEAKATANKTESSVAKIETTVVRIDENVKNLRAELGR